MVSPYPDRAGAVRADGFLARRLLEYKAKLLSRTKGFPV